MKAKVKRSIVGQLSSKGFRVTAQRRALIEIIQDAKNHLDAATLLRLGRKRYPKINRATVYRTLDLLKRLGLIDELDLMHLEGEKHYYEARPNLDHLHLACYKCGAIVEYSSPTFERLKEEIARQNDFQIGMVRLEVGGWCKQCRLASKTTSMCSIASHGQHDKAD
jgi:Fur family transcriptional regulator, ferric uptake regulator